jgi:IS5 family transposase
MPGEDHQSLVEIAVPAFGYKNHIGIDRAFCFLRYYRITHAATYDGGQLGAVLDRDNTASAVWADAAYRSAANLALLERRGLKPQFQRKEPRGKPMPAHVVRGNATRARVRSRVEHVFAAQKCRLGLVGRTVGRMRARVKIGLANLAYTSLGWLGFRRKRRPRPCHRSTKPWRLRNCQRPTPPSATRKIPRRPDTSLIKIIKTGS